MLLSGKRGSGKTTLCKSLLQVIEPQVQQTNKKPVIKIDPLNELGGIYIDYGDRRRFNEILKKVFISKNEFFVIDEADGFFPNRKTLSKLENRFIHIGRHYGLGAITVTRRLANLHTDLVSQANKIFIFKLWSRADLDYLAGSDFGHLIPIVTSLNDHEFISIDTDTNEILVNEPV